MQFKIISQECISFYNNRYTYWYCTYYVMITLIVVGLTSLLTMYGVLFEQSGTLGLSFFLYILCWFMDFIGAIIICLYGVEESETLTAELNEVFLDLIFRMEYDDRARRILKIIQEYVSAFYSRMIYIIYL